MKYLILILSILMIVKLEAQEHFNVDEIKTLDSLLEGNLPDSTKMNLFINEVQVLPPWESRVPFQLAEKGLSYSISVGDPLYIGKMQEMLGSFYDKTSIYDTAAVLYNDALVSFKKSNNLDGKIRCHLELGGIYAVSDNFEKSLNHCYEALALSKKQNDETGTGNAYFGISQTLLNSGRVEEALPNAIKSRNIFLKQNNIYGELRALSYISYCYELMGNYEQAIIILNESIDIVERESDHLDIETRAIQYQTRGSIHSESGKFELGTKDYDKARELFLSSPNPDPQSLNSLNWYEATLLFNKEEYAEAIKLLSKVLKVEKEAKRTNRSHYITKSLSQAYAELNQYDSAYYYMLEHEELSVAQKNHETSMQMEELKTKYETEKKEATIFAQEELITQQKIIQWSVLGFAGVLALLFFQSFRNVKLKKQINEH